jgi:hypothetical protein
MLYIHAAALPVLAAAFHKLSATIGTNQTACTKQARVCSTPSKIKLVVAAAAAAAAAVVVVAVVVLVRP